MKLIEIMFSFWFSSAAIGGIVGFRKLITGLKDSNSEEIKEASFFIFWAIVAAVTSYAFATVIKQILNNPL